MKVTNLKIRDVSSPFSRASGSYIDKATGRVGRIRFTAYRWTGGNWSAEASRPLTLQERLAIGRACVARRGY